MTINNKYDEMISEHRMRVRERMLDISGYLTCAAEIHDLDKTKYGNDEIYETYNKHFEKLKKIPFGTKEYKDYEKEHFQRAHYLHNQNRHHFYTEQHEQEINVNIMDIIEVICDITASAEQYGENQTNEKIAEIIYNKPKIKNYISKELIINTLNLIK